MQERAGLLLGPKSLWPLSGEGLLWEKASTPVQNPAGFQEEEKELMAYPALAAIR
jgi:hypothetical protein